MKHARGSLFGPEAASFGGGRFVAFAIGEESDYDRVLVDGHLLCAGRVLFLESTSPKISYIGGSRDTVDPWRLHIVGFECGDRVVNPGPRPTRHDKVVVLDALPYTGLAMADASYKRIPFAGRRWGRVLVLPLNEGTVNYTVYGLQWRDDGEDPYQVPLHATYAAPESAAYTAAPGPIALAFELGEGINVGGTDTAEAFDELLVVYGCSAEVPTGNEGVRIDIMVGGEIGVG